MSPINGLVKKAQKGDDKAFIQLFKQYEEDIYRMAFIYVKNKQDALDVVQDVAYQSFKKVNSLKHPEYFKTWLMKITINSAINMVNKNKKVIRLEPDYNYTEAKEEEEDLPLTLSLKDLINELETDEKSIILLRFYHGYTFNEIAKLLDIPLGTAKSILYRALKKLRKDMLEEGFCE